MLNESTGATAVGQHTERWDGQNTSPKTMRALRILAPRRIELQEIEIPEPGAGQVRVRVHGCGVCGSDLSVWQGQSWFDHPQEPGAPGHEGWGTVDKCGARVDGISVGERVAFLSTHAYAEYDLADANALVRARGISAAAFDRLRPYDPACLYTHAFDLDRAAEAFAALETRPEGLLKGWIQINNEINQWPPKQP